MGCCGQQHHRSAKGATWEIGIGETETAGLADLQPVTTTLAHPLPRQRFSTWVATYSYTLRPEAAVGINGAACRSRKSDHRPMQLGDQSSASYCRHRVGDAPS